MTNMEKFLESWDESYKAEIEKIGLFNPKKTKLLTQEQKIYFAKVFYHCRGHFHEFLWYLGNHASDKETKDIVLKNISEELNGSARSHEQLYIDFAKSVGAENIEEEIVNSRNYLPFAKEFNDGHIKWLSQHDEDQRFAAFSAYERLDNIDYIYLEQLAESLDISRKNRLFFTIHVRVEHFTSTESKLQNLWNLDSKKLNEGFEFIAKHQIIMWNKLSDAVLNY